MVFGPFETEWWHYNLGTASNDKVANLNGICDDRGLAFGHLDMSCSFKRVAQG